ncbi:MAG TPA: non-ribosomal peptide synthetase [Gammaproteobacteria bacterium]|nr:non-ribosomal peptide synthetase [Gammaproteobacteria bacterium]
MNPVTEVDLGSCHSSIEQGDLWQALGHAASLDPGAPAIYEETGVPLHYARLLEQIGYVRGELRARGISQGDCIAVMLPRSAQLTVALLGVACSAAAAPLNSDYTIDEIRAYLATLDAKAAVTVSGSIGEAAARELGIQTLLVVPDPEPISGLFRFANEETGHTEGSPGPAAGDVCAIFLTSGSTSRPKRVPLTHGVVLARAKRTIDAFSLTAEDRLLDPMPQTSAYSLVSALLPALLSGGSAVILNHFEPIRFFQRAREFSATWSVAAPPHLQSILQALERRSDLLDHHTLRVIRSGTGHLPEHVADALETRLKIPIAVGYGLVESGQIANSPAPPQQRKPGSVGLPRMEIKLVGKNGRQVRVREHGEILVRGPQVFTGYMDDPLANENAFQNGWLRTGDLGYMDEDGALFLVGRIKEMINRGGQSIAPMEIDDALLSHPAVAEAAAFAIPHESLGEDIAAAVALMPGATTTESDLIQHIATRLSIAKLPRKVLILPELPKASGGKVSRRLLSDSVSARIAGHAGRDSDHEVGAAGTTPRMRARLELEAPFAPPGTPVEEKLVTIWTEVLSLDEVGIHDGFMDLGGDSLSATQVISRIQDEFSLNLSVRLVFETSTIAELARLITRDSPRTRSS